MRRVRTTCEVCGADIRPTLRWLERVGRVCWNCQRGLKDDEGAPMPDYEVRLLIIRYLQRTGDWRGAEALWGAHLSWQRAHGLPPAG